jgi:RNA polymerase sigma-70 factor, ECF subfamily
MPAATGNGWGINGRSRTPDTPHDSEEIGRAVARAKAGDTEALRYLYIRYSDNVFQYVRSIVRDHHAAEDVTQHVFAKLMTSITR